MIRRVDNIEDEMRGTVTYDLGGGQMVRFSVEDIHRYGAKQMLKSVGVEVSIERVPVFQDGRQVGTLPGDFEPMFLISYSLLYQPRPGDFRMEDEKWVADRMLGTGDLDAVPGFQRATTE